MGLNETYKILHSKGNYRKGEQTTLRMEENYRKWNNWQRINLHNIQPAQYQKNKQPNQKLGFKKFKKWAEDLSRYCSKTYRWLINTWKDAQYHSLLEKCGSKLQWGVTSHWSKWPSSKNLEIIRAEKGVEKREPSCTAGGNVNLYHHCGEQYGGSSKTKNRATIWPTSPTPGPIPGENRNSKRYMYPNVRCSYLQQPGHRNNLKVHQQRAG